MKKMSQQEFDALRRKKGFKTKRKMGAAKKPEPEAEDIVALSGAELPEAPVPASPEPMASMGASMAARDAQLEMIVENSNKVLAEFKETIAQISKPRKRVPWDAIIHRAKNGLMNRIRLEPDES